MSVEVRLAKVEVEVETNKAAIAKLERAVEELQTTMERGFVEQRKTNAEMRTTMERGFAELRREINTHFRWLYGIILTNLMFTVGLIMHTSGLL